MKGLCDGHETPDLWFPDLPQGRRTNATDERIKQETRTAIRMCGKCPIRDECLELGMMEENLPYGIWGGVTAGERLMLAGKDIASYPPFSSEKIAYNFTINLFPHLEYK